MRLRLATFIVMLVILCVSNVQAEIYTCKDVNGITVYTDSPDECAFAEEVKVDELPTLIPAKSLASRRSSAGKSSRTTCSFDSKTMSGKDCERLANSL